MKHLIASLVAASILAAPIAIAPAFAESDNDTGTTTTAAAKASNSKATRIGVLGCDIEGGFGGLIGSSRKAQCTFKHADGSVEAYTGTLGKLGLDIGVSEKSVMRWVVFTPVGNNAGENALAGTYVGVSAGAAFGVGLGANALVGGSQKQIGLQPLSIEGKRGLNLAVGLSRLSLQPAG